MKTVQLAALFSGLYWSMIYQNRRCLYSSKGTHYQEWCDSQSENLRQKFAFAVYAVWLGKKQLNNKDDQKQSSSSDWFVCAAFQQTSCIFLMTGLFARNTSSSVDYEEMKLKVDEGTTGWTAVNVIGWSRSNNNVRMSKGLWIVYLLTTFNVLSFENINPVKLLPFSIGSQAGYHET